jgi:hypothetical protein
MYLIKNAEKIMQGNRDAAERNNNCGSCLVLTSPGRFPELEMQICNKRTCKFPMSDNRVLGMGRQTAQN